MILPQGSISLVTWDTRPYAEPGKRYAITSNSIGHSG